MYTVQYEWNFNVTLFSGKPCSPIYALMSFQVPVCGNMKKVDFVPPISSCGLVYVYPIGLVSRGRILGTNVLRVFLLFQSLLTIFSRLCPETSTKLYVHEFGFRFPPFSFFTIYSSWTVETVRRLREFEEIESQGKAVEVTVNSKEENFYLDFVQEFGLKTLPCEGDPKSYDLESLAL